MSATKEIKAGIVIDDWKLPIFRRRLSGAGYTFERSPGPTEGTFTLTVFVATSALSQLAVVVQAANDESAWLRRCAAQFVKRAAVNASDAMALAEACFDNLDGDLTENPEDAADEDMSCWG